MIADLDLALRLSYHLGLQADSVPKLKSRFHSLERQSPVERETESPISSALRLSLLCSFTSPTA
jgi:hypothetical protein